jgi:hypothetical protein
LLSEAQLHEADGILEVVLNRLQEQSHKLQRVTASMELTSNPMIT